MLRFVNELIYICIITVFIAMQSEFCYALTFHCFACLIAILKYENREKEIAENRI